MSIRFRTDAEIFLRVKNNLPLSLRELSVASGYCYTTIKEWKRHGLPLLDGRITLREALKWRRNQPSKLGVPGTRKPAAAPDLQATEYAPPSSIAGHPRLQSSSKPRIQRRGSRAPWPPS